MLPDFHWRLGKHKDCHQAKPWEARQGSCRDTWYSEWCWVPRLLDPLGRRFCGCGQGRWSGSFCGLGWPWTFRYWLLWYLHWVGSIWLMDSRRWVICAGINENQHIWIVMVHTCTILCHFSSTLNTRRFQLQFPAPEDMAFIKDTVYASFTHDVVPSCYYHSIRHSDLWIIKILCHKCCIWLGSTASSYLGAPGFRSCPRTGYPDRLFFAVYPISSRVIPD